MGTRHMWMLFAEHKLYCTGANNGGGARQSAAMRWQYRTSVKTKMSWRPGMATAEPVPSPPDNVTEAGG